MKCSLVRDFFLVFVDDLWESHTTKAGLISSNTGWISGQNSSEETEDRGEHKRRYGIIVEVPCSYSDTALEMIDPGLPQPRKYVSHDWIQQMQNAGHRGYREHENPAGRYYPSTFEEYETVKMSDIGKRVDAKQGDKVYFEPRATDMERYMGAYNHNGLEGHLFSVQVNEILCVAKKSPILINHEHYVKEKIYPQGGWVFVEISMEDWKDITTPAGVIIKVAPEALPLQGKILAAQREDLKPGLNVLFERDADAPITVDGVEMTCMQESDILAIIKPKQYEYFQRSPSGREGRIK